MHVGNQAVGVVLLTVCDAQRSQRVNVLDLIEDALQCGRCVHLGNVKLFIIDLRKRTKAESEKSECILCVICPKLPPPAHSRRFGINTEISIVCPTLQLISP